MSLREFVGKSLALIVVVGVSLVAGLLVLTGTHAGNDYVYSALGWSLIGLAVLVFIGGCFTIWAAFYEARVRRRNQQVVLTPRAGDPAPPPAWGMSDIGRPDHIVEVNRMVGAGTSGSGGIRIVGLPASSLDVPLVFGALIAWTVIALVLLAPTITSTVAH